ncbi:alpha/beta hydrolase fold-containing protein [Desulfarculus baarsii DSM 2075]|uniref:Alpha/beta hydrolase fold-containing protein n=1 Tax=Desulfarculus baarsii (strain ATCC 33931 / DSM 2075 / LMG 7858 / VKM B-1802 / 2st14) TaxID=644282 RepID=E1QKQ3_DESB2|nr:alpha/beta hydrolase [Desulfarculus baarsii]ADK86262.1 alpha/beta hydrolase fold-containing protein [Desulfarculus baarsii DSM 2075]
MAGPFETTPPRTTCLNPSASGGDVLLVHGAWHGAWCWESLTPGLTATGWRVHLLDLPGHGADVWALPAMTSIKHYADYVGRCVEAIGAPALIGHSLGGWIVQKLLETRDLPAALICPLPGGGLPLLGLLRLMAAYPLATTGTFLGRPLRIADEAMARRLFHPRIPVAELRANLARMVAEPARVMIEMGLGLARARAAAGARPRLVIAAEDDFFIAASALERLARRMSARLALLPGYPHNPWVDDERGLVLQELQRFLAEAAK